MIIFDLDDSDKNADWIKHGTIDLLGVDTEENLRATLDGLGLSVSQFKGTQVYLSHRDQFSYLDSIEQTSRAVDRAMRLARRPR